MTTGKGVLLALLLAALALLGGLLLSGDWLSLEQFQARRQQLEAFVGESPGLSALGYFLLYAGVTGLGLPVASVLTLVGGALFGFGQGLLLASFASSLGATLSFLATRALLRAGLRHRLGARLHGLERSVHRHGAFTLFSLRMVPVFPFAMINLVMGMTGMRLSTFYWVSQLGMLPGTALYVNAGVRLGSATSLPDLLALDVLLSLLALALFPWLARWALRRLRRRLPELRERLDQAG